MKGIKQYKANGLPMYYTLTIVVDAGPDESSRRKGTVRGREGNVSVGLCVYMSWVGSDHEQSTAHCYDSGYESYRREKIG